MQAKFSDGMELRKDWILARLPQISLNHKKMVCQIGRPFKPGLLSGQIFLMELFLARAFDNFCLGTQISQ